VFDTNDSSVIIKLGKLNTETRKTLFSFSFQKVRYTYFSAGGAQA